jgi:hypothetical protein
MLALVAFRLYRLIFPCTTVLIRLSASRRDCVSVYIYIYAQGDVQHDSRSRMYWKRVRCALVVSSLSIGIPSDLIAVIYDMTAARATLCRQPRQALLTVLFPRGCVFRTGYKIECQHGFVCTDDNMRILHNSRIHWRVRFVSSVAYVYNKLSDVRIGCMHYRVNTTSPSIQDY